MTNRNAFEDNEQEIPEVKEQVVDPILAVEIARLERLIEKSLELKLHNTANVMQSKLDRLLAQRNQEAPEG